MLTSDQSDTTPLAPASPQKPFDAAHSFPTTDHGARWKLARHRGVFEPYRSDSRLWSRYGHYSLAVRDVAPSHARARRRSGHALAAIVRLVHASPSSMPGRERVSSIRFGHRKAVLGNVCDPAGEVSLARRDDIDIAMFRD